MSSESDEELAALAKILEAKVKGRHSRRKLGPITPKEAVALIGYIESFDMASEKRIHNVTDKGNHEIKYNRNELQSGLTKLVEIAAASNSTLNNRKSRRLEALSWLKNSKITSAFASNHFDTTSEVAEVVKGLYTLGAAKVEFEVKDEDDYSETMIVLGSEESEERLFCYIGSLHPDKAQYECDSFFWRVWWD